MEQELAILISYKIWEPIKKSLLYPNQEILPLKWVYVYKPNTTRAITKYKARLVVRGDL
jgi:hypothetical protein